MRGRDHTECKLRHCEPNCTPPQSHTQMPKHSLYRRAGPGPAGSATSTTSGTRGRQPVSPAPITAGIWLPSVQQHCQNNPLRLRCLLPLCGSAELKGTLPSKPVRSTEGHRVRNSEAAACCDDMAAFDARLGRKIKRLLIEHYLQRPDKCLELKWR